MAEGSADRDRKRKLALGSIVRRPEPAPIEPEPVVPEGMRACPSAHGYSIPLIVQVITPAQCLQRQREFYHKCHRCQFRGKSIDFVLAPREPLVPHTNGVDVVSDGAD